PLAVLAAALRGVEGEPARVQLGDGGAAARAAPFGGEQPLTLSPTTGGRRCAGPRASPGCKGIRAQYLHRALPPPERLEERLLGKLGGRAGPDGEVDGVLAAAGELRGRVGRDADAVADGLLHPGARRGGEDVEVRALPGPHHGGEQLDGP